MEDTLQHVSSVEPAVVFNTQKQTVFEKRGQS